MWPHSFVLTHRYVCLCSTSFNNGLAPIIYLNQLKNGLFLAQFSNIKCVKEKWEEAENDDKQTMRSKFHSLWLHFFFVLFYRSMDDRTTVWFSMCHCCFFFEYVWDNKHLQICLVTDGTLEWMKNTAYASPAIWMAIIILLCVRCLATKNSCWDDKAMKFSGWKL